MKAESKQEDKGPYPPFCFSVLISRGVYHLAEDGPVSDTDLVAVATRIPHGVDPMTSLKTYLHPSGNVFLTKPGKTNVHSKNHLTLIPSSRYLING